MCVLAVVVVVVAVAVAVAVAVVVVVVVGGGGDGNMFASAIELVPPINSNVLMTSSGTGQH